MTEEQIQNIAENLDAGCRCFIHRENKTVICFPDPDDLAAAGVESENPEAEEVFKNIESYFEIEHPDSRQKFRMMARFAETVDDGRLREKLEHILERPKPFRNFKNTIDFAGEYRQKWFAFKSERMREYVEKELRFFEILTD